MQEVRDDALLLLDALSSRVWRESGATVASVRPGTPLLPGQILHASPHAAVVIGALQDSFQDFQLRLSSKLARCGILCMLGPSIILTYVFRTGVLPKSKRFAATCQLLILMYPGCAPVPPMQLHSGSAVSSPWHGHLSIPGS